MPSTFLVAQRRPAGQRGPPVAAAAAVGAAPPPAPSRRPARRRWWPIRCGSRPRRCRPTPSSSSTRRGRWRPRTTTPTRLDEAKAEAIRPAGRATRGRHRLDRRWPTATPGRSHRQPRPGRVRPGPTTPSNPTCRRGRLGPGLRRGRAARHRRRRDRLPAHHRRRSACRSPDERLIPEGARHTIVGDRSTNRRRPWPWSSSPGARASTPRPPSPTPAAGRPPTGCASTSTRRSRRGAQVATDEGGSAVVEVDLPAGDRVEAFLESRRPARCRRPGLATAGRRRGSPIQLCTPAGRKSGGKPVPREGVRRRPRGVTVEPCDGSQPGTGATSSSTTGWPSRPTPAPRSLAIARARRRTRRRDRRGPEQRPSIRHHRRVATPTTWSHGLDLSQVGIATAQRLDPRAAATTLVGRQRRAAGAAGLGRRAAVRRPRPSPWATPTCPCRWPSRS